MADNDENDLSTIVAHLTSSSMGGLNFIALDFDQTILEVHTGGFWEGTLEELVHHVRPEMRQLLPALVYSTNDNTNDKQNRTLHVAVVTFSSQPDMVRNVIQSVLTTCTTTENDLANNNSHDVVIPIRGEDGSWKTPNPIHRGERWWGTEAATTTTAVAANATFCRSDNSCWELNPDDDDDDDEEEEEEEEQGKQPHMVSAIQELELMVDGLKITKSTSLLIDDDEDNVRIARKNGVRAIWLDPDHPQCLFSDLSNLK